MARFDAHVVSIGGRVLKQLIAGGDIMKAGGGIKVRRHRLTPTVRRETPTYRPMKFKVPKEPRYGKAM